MSELEQILDRSKASEPFKVAVRGYVPDSFRDRIHVEGFAPAVKVRRLLTHMLATEPDLQIVQIRLQAESGCSDFVGTVQVRTTTETHEFSFAWDCRWRAEQEGWTDYFGFPDQIRAAREFEWRCFERWERVDAAAASVVL